MRSSPEEQVIIRAITALTDNLPTLCQAVTGEITTIETKHAHARDEAYPPRNNFKGDPYEQTAGKLEEKATPLRNALFQIHTLLTTNPDLTIEDCPAEFKKTYTDARKTITKAYEYMATIKAIRLDCLIGFQHEAKIKSFWSISYDSPVNTHIIRLIYRLADLKIVSPPKHSPCDFFNEHKPNDILLDKRLRKRDRDYIKRERANPNLYEGFNTPTRLINIIELKKRPSKKILKPTAENPAIGNATAGNASSGSPITENPAIENTTAGNPAAETPQEPINHLRNGEIASWVIGGIFTAGVTATAISMSLLMVSAGGSLLNQMLTTNPAILFGVLLPILLIAVAGLATGFGLRMKRSDCKCCFLTKPQTEKSPPIIPEKQS